METNREDRIPNRLIHEKSPYLLQHAHNPVDWYAWDEEAFDRARQENKPVFLSIGYSTCHWCHVMEHESFEDEEVAQMLNGYFVSIKVDREERPDIDAVYMSVCQGLTGQGGWPLTIIMTPDKKPFYAATYLPKSTRGGLPGLMQLLPQIAQLWQNDPEAAATTGERIADWLKRTDRLAQNKEINKETLRSAFQHFSMSYDKKFGGFGAAPKFPTPHNLIYLLRYWYYTGEERALEMVEHTLACMYQGGIYDHIGYGFARYSTDAAWLVPHFEKMLYDNALLAMAYLEAFQATGKRFYARIAREIFTYVAREMTAPEGGFYSAQDADSEGEEGRFYVWSPDEVMEQLGEESGGEFCGRYNIRRSGNFEGKSIPNLIASPLSEEERSGMEAFLQRLYRHRQNRVAPLKDDKILMGWNGLMMAALAMGARILGEPDYLETARRTWLFLKKNLVGDNGRWLVRYREGEARFPALSSDYAAVVWALLELYRSTLEIDYLREAIDLNHAMNTLFWDHAQGGWFYYGSDAEQLLTNPKEVYDGAMPSVNSVGLNNLVFLYRFTGDPELLDQVQKLEQVFSGEVSGHPWAHSFFLTAAMQQQYPARDVVLVGLRQDPALLGMINIVEGCYAPDVLVSLKETTNGLTEKLMPFSRDMQMIGNKPAAYVCSGFSCQAPTTDLQTLASLLVPIHSQPSP